MKRTEKVLHLQDRILHVTEPHGEHRVTVEDDGIFALHNSEDNRIAFTDEELDSLALWWLSYRRTNGHVRLI